MTPVYLLRGLVTVSLGVRKRHLLGRTRIPPSPPARPHCCPMETHSSPPVPSVLSDGARPAELPAPSGLLEPSPGCWARIAECSSWSPARGAGHGLRSAVGSCLPEGLAVPLLMGGSYRATRLPSPVTVRCGATRAKIITSSLFGLLTTFSFPGLYFFFIFIFFLISFTKLRGMYAYVGLRLELGEWRYKIRWKYFNFLFLFCVCSRWGLRLAVKLHEHLGLGNGHWMWRRVSQGCERFW